MIGRCSSQIDSKYVGKKKLSHRKIFGGITVETKFFLLGQVCKGNGLIIKVRLLEQTKLKDFR